jgi:ATP-dependent DNA helicase DinG
MPNSQPPSSDHSAGARRILLPAAPAVVPGLATAVWMSEDGEVETLELAEAARRVASKPPYLCHGPAQARRLGLANLAAFDLIELFAFVHPARFAVPTPRGLTQALGLGEPEGPESEAAVLPTVAHALLAELTAGGTDEGAAAIARTMARAGWLWGPAVLAALGLPEDDETDAGGRRARAVWESLAEWEEEAPPPPPGQAAVAASEARQRLAELLGTEAESRPQQADYASAVSQAFAPRAREGEPNLVLAEAGTGVGKTLGYIAPASLWAEKNSAPVWISTYTRNLQHQVDDELDRLFPQAAEKRRRVVIRKGRENYLCLLNLEEATHGLGPGHAVAMGLMARWTAATRDGDMVGGDFPGWLVGLIGPAATLGLTDRRGECVYSACRHYHRCFIERAQRRARYADIVVANHALVLTRAALDQGEEGALPGHLVLDEGHHLFEAADSAFAIHLSGREGQELRRWILGGEGRRAALAARGLQRRLDGLLSDRNSSRENLARALTAAHALPGTGWRQRLAEGRPQGPTEVFLATVREQVFARAQHGPGGYGLQAETHPTDAPLLERADQLRQALEGLYAPLVEVRRALLDRLREEGETLEPELRRRLDAAARGIERRALTTLSAWQAMLANLEEGETPEDFCDWFAVERHEGRETDVGYYRHWVDPSLPLAETLLVKLQGAVITSATLTDAGADSEADWIAAEARLGAAHLPVAPIRAKVSSPFDYSRQTRVLVVTDLPRDRPDQVAAAFRALFLAAGGGALGLFTAIQRLRVVHAAIGPALAERGIPLLAQHIDPMDTATLVDIFRAEADTCLLGTDALRDGVDVPGEALRLVVFERVPWARPDLIHKARREVFGGRDYDDRLARRRLRQAFGRLVRRADDRGVFVMLDRRLPSRLLSAFPSEVTVARVGLAEAVAETAAFLSQPPAGSIEATE